MSFNQFLRPLSSHFIHRITRIGTFNTYYKESVLFTLTISKFALKGSWPATKSIHTKQHWLA